MPTLEYGNCKTSHVFILMQDHAEQITTEMLSSLTMTCILSILMQHFNLLKIKLLFPMSIYKS